MPDDDSHQWLDRLIADAHQHVDRIRIEKGLPKWYWGPGPLQHRIRGPLADLIRTITIEEEPVMGRVKDISCFKQCGFIGGSPNEMHAHYIAHPDHSRKFVAKRTYSKKVNGVAKSSASAMEQFGHLLDTFNIEIDQELTAIQSLQDEINTRSANLVQLKDVRNRLAGGPAPERPDFHESVAGMVMDSLSRTE
jgi:hypothetical protein